MRSRRVTSVILSLLITAPLVIILLVPLRASAQMSIARIQITNVDASGFPDITIQAIVRYGNGDLVPISDQQSNLELLEKVSGKYRDVSPTMSETASGLDVIFVLDLGIEIGRNDPTAQLWLKQMQDIIKSYVTGMKENDTTGIWVITSVGINRLQPLTSSQVNLRDASDNLPVAHSWTDGVAGITDALTELSKSPRRGSVIQSIVFMTCGLYKGEIGIGDLANKAREAEVTIHTILVRDFEYPKAAEPLKTLADESAPGSLYAYYTGELDIKPIFTWRFEQRQQTQLSFRSSFGDSAERTLELRVKDGMPLSTKTYRVDIQAPVVEITKPTNNSEYERRVDDYEQGQSKSTMDSVDPANVEVAVSVTWPDGYQRAITQAQFLLDDIPVQIVDNPVGAITFFWDLTQYWTADIKDAPHKLVVRVQDELGMESLSAPVTTKVTVTIPAKPTPAPEPTTEPTSEPEVMAVGIPPTPTPTACEGKEDMNLTWCRFTNNTFPQIRHYFSQPSNWVSIGSLLVALVAVILAIHFRRKIVRAGSAAIGVVRGTMTRLSHPSYIPEIGACLEVLGGDEELKGKTIPLYARSVTPAGRSPQEAGLVFDRANERSVVSRRHCEFCEKNGIFKIRDLGSTHGTYVNGVRLPEGGEGQALSEGDKIELGPAERGGILLLFKFSSSRRGSTENEDVYKTNPAYLDYDSPEAGESNRQRK